MKPNQPQRLRRTLRKRGFALVISLSLMVLLTVLAVGLLGLSTISLRASGAGEARAEAQANARLALMLAIGDLQKAMGPDRAVSARASSINENAAEPNMLGAWQSWRWDPSSGGSPSYSDKAAKFAGWLVSSAQPEESRLPSFAGSTLTHPVWLVNPATVGVPQDAANPLGSGLRASKVLVQSSETRFGTFAYAVLDESQRAPMNLAQIEPTTDGERIARRTAPGRARPETVVAGLAPETLGDPRKLVSLNSAVVAVGKEQGREILRNQNDLTPYSMGLMTNTVEGGLKTDLTTLFESSSASVDINGQPTLYYTAADGAPRWEYLRSHYQLSRRVTNVGQGTPSVSLGNNTDLAINTTGLNTSPTSVRLLPVIAKLQVMFSLVSHYSHFSDRVAFYNSATVPANMRGNDKFGVPHLVYDPVITLYNPYDVALDLSKIRVRVWDPPVVFRFRKNADWIRPDFASGNFHGLARFQYQNEGNPNARRYSSFLLSELRPNRQPGKAIALQPGEVKVFAPWVEPDWTWGKEAAGGWSASSFFDFSADFNFGNRDGRTKNQFGMETVPGWDPRAGLQLDHIAGPRVAASIYPWENGAGAGRGGWVAVHINDTFTVESKPGRTVTLANQPDFVVDLLAGRTINTGNLETTSNDMLRTYRFRYGNVANEISANPSRPTITRTFKVGDILQKPADKTPGGKSPFAVLSMTAKTTRAPLDFGIPWVQNHPVVEGAEQISNRVGSALDSYDLRFEEVADFNASPGGIEFDGGTNRGYYGATPYAQGGVSNVPMFRVPVMPSASLGDLVPANLITTSHLPRVTHAFGNSRAHPLIPGGEVTRRSPTDSGGTTTRTAYNMLDHSYLINDALWDGTYFSTVADFSNPLLSSPGRKALLQEFLQGDRLLLNPRLVPILQGEGSAQEIAAELDGLSEDQLARRIGSVIGVRGPFNVNSDSIGAWKAVLSSLRDVQVKGWTLADVTPDGKTGFSRFSLPLAGDPEATPKSAGIDLAGTLRWAGFRALNDAQIDTLARRIVEEIRLRGKEDQAPSLSLGEFVNRRLGSSGSLQTLAGLLQTAIDKSGINDAFHREDSKDLASERPPNANATRGVVNEAARELKSAEGAPSILTQGDLLMALAPVITVRGDTFRIRAYGESKGKGTPGDPMGGKVEAKAWCEAVIQRMPEYLDTVDSPELKDAQLTKDANRRFGRRFVITSFRWLSPEEV